VVLSEHIRQECGVALHESQHFLQLASPSALTSLGALEGAPGLLLFLRFEARDQRVELSKIYQIVVEQLGELCEVSPRLNTAFADKVCVDRFVVR